MRNPIDRMTAVLARQIDDIPAPDISADFYAMSPTDVDSVSTSSDDTHTALSSNNTDRIFDAALLAQDMTDVPTPEISSELQALTLDDAETALGAIITAEASPPFSEEDNEAPSKRSVTEYRAARMAEEKHRFLMWLDTLYIWISPAYRKLKENELIAILKDSFDENITEQKTVAFWRGVIAQLESNSNNFIELSEIHHPDEEVVFRNGVYNVRTQKIRPASPDDYFLMNDI